jgi:hypothetical protein
MANQSNDDNIVLAVSLGEYVGTLRFSLDPGITEAQRARIRAIKQRAAVTAHRTVADRTGVRFVWPDGVPCVFTMPAWETWWVGRRPLEGWGAIRAYKDFERFLYGEVLGPKLVAALQRGEQSLYTIKRDFPKAAEHNTVIRALVQSMEKSGRAIRPGRGEKSASTREAALDRWMTTVSRIKELRRADPALSVEASCGKIAEDEGRVGHDPAAAVLKEYERGLRWQRMFRLD